MIDRSAPPMMLAIETSQAGGGVAVGGLASEVVVEMLAPASRHDDDLLPAIDRLMTRLGFRPRDLQAVAVSIGPGGFTGLRIAAATAKMMAEALGLKIVAVPSALVAAESLSRDPPGPLLVALSCKGEAFWLTQVARRAGHWLIEGGPGLVEPDRLDLTSIRAVLADEHLPAAARQRCASAGVPILAPVFDPAACWRVGMRMLLALEFTDALDLLPVYAREPEAVSLWKQRSAVRR